MPIFYRGAGVGTYWHINDPRISGFLPHSPGVTASADRVKEHIAHVNTTSPYISLTRSYGVARSYALGFGRSKPTASAPAFVWEIELNDPCGVSLVDPVKIVAAQLPSPLDPLSYHHDGAPICLVGLIDVAQGHLLNTPCPVPPNSNPPAQSPNISLELKTMIFALRDAEVLAIGAIPAACVACRHEIY